MKATEIKQLKQALEVMQACFTPAEVMAERAKEREQWGQILDQLKKLEEPIETYQDIWSDKQENLSAKQRDTHKGEVIHQVARTYEDLVDKLQSMMSDIEYLLETEI